MLSEFARESGTNQNLTISLSEKKQLEPVANLVAIIRTVEALEKSFVNGLCEEADYEKQCNALISQFKVGGAALKVFL